MQESARLALRLALGAGVPGSRDLSGTGIIRARHAVAQFAVPGGAGRSRGHWRYAVRYRHCVDQQRSSAPLHWTPCCIS